MFESTATKERVKVLLKAGAKAGEVVTAIGGSLVIQDVYNIKLEMRKAGELPPTGNNMGKRSEQPKPAKGKLKVKNGGDDFDTAVSNEIAKVEGDIERMNSLADSYDKTNSEFASFLETKIIRETKKLAALREFQKN